MPGPHPAHPGPPARSRRRSLTALLLLVPVPSLGVAAAYYGWPGAGVGKLLFGLAKIWIVLLPAIWWRWIDRQPLSLSPPRHGGFLTAALLGVLMALAILTAYAWVESAGWIDARLVADQAAQTGLNRLPVYLLGALYWITVNSLVEEYVWRWFAFRHFETLFGAPIAVAASALAFTAHHVLALAAQFSWPMTLLGSLGVLAGGITWSWLYARYRSIWPCYVSHAIVDVPIFLIGYRLIFQPAP